MEHLTGAMCPSCETEDSMAMEVQQAAHNPQLIDIVVTCCICGTRFNEFVDVNNMEVLGE